MIEEAVRRRRKRARGNAKAAREVCHELLEQIQARTPTRRTTDVVNAGRPCHIIGTERHESRRIDNQLRGRAGRQGDPGSSRFFVSFEDDLMRLFGSDRLKPMVDKLPARQRGDWSTAPCPSRSRTRRSASRAATTISRKHVLQYDDVMNTAASGHIRPAPRRCSTAWIFTRILCR